jgi:hypothetical protein
LDPCREEEEFSLDRSGRFLEPDVLPDGGVRSCADPSAAGRGAAERFRLRIPQQGVSDNLIPAYFVTWFPLVWAEVSSIVLHRAGWMQTLQIADVPGLDE